MAPARWYSAAIAELAALTTLVEALEAAAETGDTSGVGVARAAFTVARKRSLVETGRVGRLVTPDEIDAQCDAIDALAVRGDAADQRLIERVEAQRLSPEELAERRARASARAADSRAERIAARRMARDSRKATAVPAAPVLDLGRHRTHQAGRNRLAEAIAAVHLAVGGAARVGALRNLRKAALEVGDEEYAAWARKELRHAGPVSSPAESDPGVLGQRVLA